MSEHNQEKRKSFIKKMISNSKAIITHQIAMPLGSQTMGKIIYWINNIEPLNDIDLTIFSIYNAEIQSLPIGVERLSYNIDFLKSEDSKLYHITAKYNDNIIEKCFEIIKQYGVEKD